MTDVDVVSGLEEIQKGTGTSNDSPAKIYENKRLDLEAKPEVCG